MKKYFRFYLSSGFCIFCTLSIYCALNLLSCSYIEPVGGKVEFRSYNLPLYPTKSAFQYGNRCDIHIIHSGTRNSYTGGSPLSAQSGDYGSIIPSYPVYLGNGIYDFYLISANCGDYPNLVFNNGYCAVLNNGFDYLWTGLKGVTIAGDRTLTFNFKRLSCRIEINVKSAPQVKNMVVKKIEFALPDPAGCILDMISGTIASDPGNGYLSEIAGSGNSRVFTMLPKSGRSEIAVEIDGEINGVNVVSKRYKALLSNHFTSGNYYQIDLGIESDLQLSVKMQLSPWRFTYNENIFNYKQIE